jgi:hypothetical protein
VYIDDRSPPGTKEERDIYIQEGLDETSTLKYRNLVVVVVVYLHPVFCQFGHLCHVIENISPHSHQYSCFLFNILSGLFGD